MILGDSSSFSISISWEQCPVELADPGQKETWAEFSLTCKGRVLTRYVDPVGQHDGIIGPASALAMWIGRSFAALASDERLYRAERATDAHSVLQLWTETDWDEHEYTLEGWLTSHSLQSVGQGLILPNVLFWRHGNHFRISWRSDPEPRTERQIQYISTGMAVVEARAVLNVLRDFVLLVSKRIDRAPAHSTARQVVQRAAERLSRRWEEQTDIIAGRLGRSSESLLDALGQRASSPSSVRKYLSEKYGVDLNGVTRPEEIDSPIAMAARSTGPDFSAADHSKLIELSKELRRLEPAQGIRQLRAVGRQEAVSPLQVEDYLVGYQCAEALRAHLANPGDFLDVEYLLRSKGCAVLDCSFDDADTDGVALWQSDERSLIAVNKDSPRASTRWGRRTLLAHELYHLLFDTHDRRLFGECRSAWTAAPSERKANAFAAELLLPKTALPEPTRVQDVSFWQKTVGDLCTAYQVGRELAIRQLQNRIRLPPPLVEALLSDPGRDMPPANTTRTRRRT